MTKIVLLTSRRWNEYIAQELIKLSSDYDVHLMTEKDEFNFEALSTIKPEWIFIPHWSHIIPEKIYKNFNCVIFHMTDLPYGRGGSPLQNLIVRGHKQTMVSAIKCVKELDAGPIYLKHPLDLSGSATEIFSRFSAVCLEMITKIIKNDLIPEVQSGDAICFERRKPSESNLIAANTTEKAFDYIRMLDAEGYPHAFLETETLRYEFKDAKMVDGELRAQVVIRRKDELS